MSEKGTNSTRVRNAAKQGKIEDKSGEAPVADLAEQMEFQKEMQQQRELHIREMNSYMEGIADQLTSKPSLWARITGRYKDIFIVYNHNIPIYCSKSECPTKRSGVNWGIEAVTTDLTVAFDALRNYFNRCGELPFAYAKILHLQVDRRKGLGAVVDEMSWTWGEFRNSDLYDDEKKITAKMVDKIIKKPL